MIIRLRLIDIRGTPKKTLENTELTAAESLALPFAVGCAVAPVLTESCSLEQSILSERYQKLGPQKRAAG